MLHILAPQELNQAMVVLEDGGEMVAIALSAALAVGLFRVGAEYLAAAGDLVPRQRAPAREALAEAR
jgi:hypothetical protein